MSDEPCALAAAISEATCPDDPPLLQVNTLSRRFGDIVAVCDVSFSIARGEIVGFLGPNGAGKSTTMQMLAGTLAPSTGSIYIDGIDLLGNPLAAKAKIGYLPEHPPLYREQYVDELLMFCAALRGLPRGQRKAAVARAKFRTGLNDVGKRVIGNLSKGYQQRVGIAQALVHDPAIVILDEPTSSLDPNQLRDIRALIAGLRAQHCVILSTHILAEVQTVCDRVLMLNHGRILLDRPLADITRSDQNIHNIFLRDPCSPQQLRQLGDLRGVHEVVMLKEHGLRIEHDGEDTTLDAIVASCSSLGIRELSEQQHSLEELFIALTLSDTAEADSC